MRRPCPTVRLGRRDPYAGFEFKPNAVRADDHTVGVFDVVAGALLDVGIAASGPGARRTKRREPDGELRPNRWTVGALIGLGGQAALGIALAGLLGVALVQVLRDDSIMMLSLFVAPFVFVALLMAVAVDVWLVRLLLRVRARDRGSRVDVAAAGILGTMAGAVVWSMGSPAIGAAVALVSLPVVVGALEPDAWRSPREPSPVIWYPDPPSRL